MQRNASVGEDEGEGEGDSAREVVFGEGEVVVRGRQAMRVVICNERGRRQAPDASPSRSAVPLHTYKIIGTRSFSDMVCSQAPSKMQFPRAEGVRRYLL